MRRILVAATIAAAACGSKPTIMATPEIKATASQAQLGMSSASTNTQASIGLQSIALAHAYGLDLRITAGAVASATIEEFAFPVIK